MGWPVTMPLVFVAFGTLAAVLAWAGVRVEAEGLTPLGELAPAVILFGDAVPTCWRCAASSVSRPGGSGSGYP